MIEIDVELLGPDALPGLDDFSHVEVLFHLAERKIAVDRHLRTAREGASKLEVVIAASMYSTGRRS